MTAATPDTAPAPPAAPVRKRTSFGHALRSMLFVHAFQGWWFLGAILALGLVATIVMVQVTDDELSMVQFGRQGFTWYPFSMAVMGVAMMLRPHVAVGRTRRGFADGAIVAAALVAVAYGLVLAVLFVLEGVIHDVLGWDHRVVEQAWFPFGQGDLAGMLLGHVLLIGSGQMSGLLVSIVYQRVGGWWGTVSLPLTAAPVVLAMFLLGWVSEGRVEPWVGVAAPLVLAVLAALAFRVLVRGYAVRT